MNVEFSNIEDMLVDLKKSKIKHVRVQTLSRKTTITCGIRNNKSYIPYKLFEVIVTARNKDEIWMYNREIGLVSGYDDKRRLNTANKRMNDAELEIRNILIGKNKIEVSSGVYR